MQDEVDYNYGYGGFTLSPTQQQQLRTLLSTATAGNQTTLGLGVPIYNYVLGLINDEDNDSAGIDPNVLAWITGAPGVNGDTSSGGTFIRNYTTDIYNIRYGSDPTQQQLNYASNQIAIGFASNILANDGNLPSIVGLGAIDAGYSASGLFTDAPEDANGVYSPWAGTLLFPYLNVPGFYITWLLNMDTVSGTTTSNPTGLPETVTYKTISGTYDIVSALEAYRQVASLANISSNLGALLQRYFSGATDASASLAADTQSFFLISYGITSDQVPGIGSGTPFGPLLGTYTAPDYIAGTVNGTTATTALIINDTSVLGSDVFNAGPADDFIDVVQSSGLIDGGGGNNIASYAGWFDQAPLTVYLQAPSTPYFTYRLQIDAAGSLVSLALPSTTYLYEIQGFIGDSGGDTLDVEPLSPTFWEALPANLTIDLGSGANDILLGDNTSATEVYFSVSGDTSSTDAVVSDSTGSPASDGVAVADPGKIVVSAGPATSVLTISGDLSSSLGVGGTVEFVGSSSGSTVDASGMSSSNTVEIQPGTGRIATDMGPQETLKLDTPAMFTGTITGFAIGNAIDLVGVSAAYAALSGNNLYVPDAGGGVSLTLDPNQNYSEYYAVATPDGSGGTDVTLASVPNLVPEKGTTEVNYDDSGSQVSTEYDQEYIGGGSSSITLYGDIGPDIVSSSFFDSNGTLYSGALSPDQNDDLIVPSDGKAYYLGDINPTEYAYAISGDIHITYEEYDSGVAYPGGFDLKGMIVGGSTTPVSFFSPLYGNGIAYIVTSIDGETGSDGNLLHAPDGSYIPKSIDFIQVEVYGGGVGNYYFVSYNTIETIPLGPSATVTGASDGTYTPYTGPTAASALTFVGNTNLDQSIDVGFLDIGTTDSSGSLNLDNGSEVTAASAAIAMGSLQVSGTGSKLAVAGALTLAPFQSESAASATSNTMSVLNWGAVQVGSLTFTPYTTLTGPVSAAGVGVDATSTLEVGSAGGALAGKIIVDAGATISGFGTLFAAGGIVDNGTIDAVDDMFLESGISGAGVIDIESNATADLSLTTGPSTVPVDFVGSNATLAIEPLGGTLGLSVQGTISGFSAGDTIAYDTNNVSGAVPLTAAVYTASSANSGTLTLEDGSTVLGTLNLTGNYAGNIFQVTPGVSPGFYDISVSKPPVSDFNGDGTSDILFQNTNGSIDTWLLDDATVTSGAVIANPGTSWHAAGTGDFNGDGKSDILFQNDDGTVAIWLVSGQTVTLGTEVAEPGPSWHIVGTGDFNGDGKSDIVFQNNDGSVDIWEMNGTTVLAGTVIANPGPSWHIVGTGDFEGTGQTDLLLQNDDGTVETWQTNGTSLTSGTVVANPGPSWHIVGTGDFNGDGKSDIVLQNNDGTVNVWEMNGSSVASSTKVGDPGPSWHAVSVGDYNGDGKPDILFQNDDGTVETWLMNGTSVVSGSVVANPGTAWQAIGQNSIHFIDGTQSTGTLTGTILNDDFVFTTSQPGMHLLQNFDPLHDMISLDQTKFGSYAAVQAAESTVNGSTVLTLGTNDTLTINGVLPGALSAKNFV